MLELAYVEKSCLGLPSCSPPTGSLRNVDILSHCLRLKLGNIEIRVSNEFWYRVALLFLPWSGRCSLPVLRYWNRLCALKNTAVEKDTLCFTTLEIRPEAILIIPNGVATLDSVDESIPRGKITVVVKGNNRKASWLILTRTTATSQEDCD
jgi:hypothetical protein